MLAGKCFTLRSLFTLAVLCAVAAPELWAQGETLENLRKKPITTDPGPVGELLRQWWKDGTAAGNAGDIYDNRDRGHSPMNLAAFPQLQKFVYTEEERKRNRDWTGQSIIMPGVVFGNSSTSAPPSREGSNVRSYYVDPAGLAFLYRQYTKNNVYVYPEHRDHDPGHNGASSVGDPDGGYGDLYPTNTPYLFTSQGSSYTDQPFLRAIAFTLAAFRPEVKEKLTKAGLLMPTLQMIFRSTYAPPSARGKNGETNPKDYLTGKAHPTVFEGSWINDLGMVRMAHDMKEDNVPPMIQLRTIAESKVVAGRDFFDDAKTGEFLTTSQVVIARVFRGKNFQRHLIVSAANSYDLNKKPLTFTWVLLRGNPNLVKIVPRNKEQTEVEIIVGYHERRPIAPGSPMESNRVDIGVFAHNGTYYSAPGFITYFFLDNEARAYDEKGRVLEIGHGMGETNISVTNWQKFLETAASEPAAKLLNLKPDQRQFLQKVLLASKKLQNEKAMNDLLDGKTKEIPQSTRVLAGLILMGLMRDPTLFENPALAEIMQNAAPIRLAAVRNERKRLAALGLAADDKGPKLRLKPLRPGTPQRWTPYEAAQIQRFNAAILANLVFPGSVSSSYQVNYVDARLSSPREWRDVFHYDDKGVCTGWTRYDDNKTQNFNADGKPEAR